jgi:DNA-binding PadR family transcriptional regulator
VADGSGRFASRRARARRDLPPTEPAPGEGPPPVASGFSGPFGGGRIGGGPRAKRGEIRQGILALLRERPHNGYQLMQELEHRSHGVWRPSPGSVYPTLQQLEDEGLVAGEEAGGGRTFSLTPRGETWIKNHPRRFAAPWAQFADATAGDYIALLDYLRSINMTARQLLQLGSPQQKKSASELLKATRRSLLQILADDEQEQP